MVKDRNSNGQKLLSTKVRSAGPEAVHSVRGGKVPQHRRVLGRGEGGIKCAEKKDVKFSCQNGQFLSFLAHFRPILAKTGKFPGKKPISRREISRLPFPVSRFPAGECATLVVRIGKNSNILVTSSFINDFH